MKGIIMILAGALLTTGLAKEAATALSIIPAPVSMTFSDGTFTLKNNCTISYPVDNSELKTGAEMIAEMLGKATGLVFSTSSEYEDGGIILTTLDREIDNREGYTLSVSPDKIIIGADSYSGVFYAFQTILQMLPADVYSPKGAHQGKYEIPCVEITDYPRFQWRGMHLDVSRHFFPKEFIYKFLDLMAMHKLNVFHWHLTDDQGWRIEIKKYPLLTQKAAWRNEGASGIPQNKQDNAKTSNNPYGGFYTQMDVKDIVSYAAKRGITVVPEIEMPGHSGEVISAYPELSCTGKEQVVASCNAYPKGYTSTLCAGNEKTFELIQGVIDEVIELFPSEYIHVGGDEADKTNWKTCAKCQARMKSESLRDAGELQSYFIKRIEKYLISKNRKLIGWDEILEGGIAPEATVMSWRGMNGGIEAAKQGHNVVMTPGSHLYFDHYQSTPEEEPAAIGGFTTTKKVYGFEPVPPELNAEQDKLILGAQANTWTEYMTTPEMVEYMVVPRISALAEVVWSPKGNREWNDFSKRLYTAQMPRFDAMGINYHKGSDYISFAANYDKNENVLKLSMECEIYGAEIRYTTDGSMPGLNSMLYTQPIEIKAPVLIKAILTRDGKIISKNPSERYLGMHKGFMKHITYNSPYSKQYKAKGDNTLNDGFTGSADFNDGLNQGICNVDMDIVYDLGSVQNFNSVKGSFLQSVGAWIYYPTELVVMTSDDGKKFIEAGRTKTGFDASIQQSRKIIEVKGSFKGRYVKVIGINPITPKGLPGEGRKNWIFVDEVFIE